MHPVVILCGGLGTRLRPITNDEVPKCMVPIAGRPFLAWKIDSLREQGFTDIRLAVAHLGDQIEDAFPDFPIERDDGYGVDWFRHRYLTEPEWVTYGDSLTRAPCEAIEAVTHDISVYTIHRLNGVLWEDYGMILRRPHTFGLGYWEVNDPYHDINTPKSYALTEEYLMGVKA